MSAELCVRLCAALCIVLHAVYTYSCSVYGYAQGYGKVVARSDVSSITFRITAVEGRDNRTQVSRVILSGIATND